MGPRQRDGRTPPEKGAEGTNLGKTAVVNLRLGRLERQGLPPMTGTEKGGRWLAPALATATALGYAFLALTLFPLSLQFAKYPRAAAEYLAGTIPRARLLHFITFYFY